MITLITGLPGNGKTLYAISWLKAKAEKEQRQVYYSGISDCMVPGWIELPVAEDWPTLPAGAIILIDEVQRVMRPRQHGTTVPPHVAKLETHRHMGVDLVLVTQHPMLLDPNCRRLVGQHFHVIRKFGTHRATIHEWSATKESCDKNRDDSIRHEWVYPKEAFGLYKSAELHTHKRRIPMKVWLLLALPFVIGALTWTAWSRLDPRRKQEQLHEQQTSGSSLAAASASRVAAKMTPTQYVEQFSPRVAGLAYTAPVYDEVTKPTVAPYPAACVASVNRCQCYTQQGTRLETGVDLCKQIAAGGFFVAWSQPVVQALPVVSKATALPSQPETVALLGGMSSLGGESRSRSTMQAGLPSSAEVDQSAETGGRKALARPPAL